VSCSGEPAAFGPCGTILPTLAPEERSLGRALELGPLDVALDHLGRYHVAMGEAILVRGLIQDMALGVANTTDGSFSASFFILELEDAVTGKALPRNEYDKGMVEGFQRVNVYLNFELLSYEPGAVVRVEHVLVR